MTILRNYKQTVIIILKSKWTADILFKMVRYSYNLFKNVNKQLSNISLLEIIPNMIIMRQNVPWCLDNYDEMIAILPIHNGTICPIMDWEIFGHKYFHFQASRSAKMGFLNTSYEREVFYSAIKITYYMHFQPQSS